MLRAISAIYYGAVAHVDEQVGRLLGELERLGMADNTLVLFTADHGNMLGDRGRMFKGIMYEGSTHVPLLWRGPKGAAENNGRVENKLIENTDLLPTILESAGLPVPGARAGLQLPQARAQGDADWKDRAYAQLATAMYRTPEFKFIDNSRDLSADCRALRHAQRSEGAAQPGGRAEAEGFRGARQAAAHAVARGQARAGEDRRHGNSGLRPGGRRPEGFTKRPAAPPPRLTSLSPAQTWIANRC